MDNTEDSIESREFIKNLSCPLVGWQCAALAEQCRYIHIYSCRHIDLKKRLAHASSTFCHE